MPTILAGSSTLDEPRLEFAFECKIIFSRRQSIAGTLNGVGRNAFYVAAGEFQGPRLRGKVVADSGGDYGTTRPDGTLSFDARYMLQVDDGTLIFVQNHGYLWGRKPDILSRLFNWTLSKGPAVSYRRYYMRAFPTFEVEQGKHDWLMRYVFVGIGERLKDGNRIRYFALL